MRFPPSLAALMFSLMSVPSFAQVVEPMESTAGWKPYNPTVEARLAARGGELLVTIPYTDGKRDTYVLYKNLAVDLPPGATLAIPVFIPKKSFLSLEVYVDDKSKRVFSYRPGTDKVETIEVPLDGAKLTKLTFSFSEPGDQVDTGTEERTFRIGAVSLKGKGVPVVPAASPVVNPSGSSLSKVVVDDFSAGDAWKKVTGNLEGEIKGKKGELKVTVPFRDSERDIFGISRKMDVDLSGMKNLKVRALIPSKSFLTVEWLVDGTLSRILSYKAGSGNWETLEFPVKGSRLGGMNFSFGEPADKKETGDESRSTLLGEIWLEGDKPAASATAAPSATPAPSAGPFPPSSKPSPANLSGANIFPEGNFEKMKKDFAEGWVMGGYCWDGHRPNRVSMEKENGNAFARLLSGLSFEKGAVWVISDAIPLDPSWKKIRAAVMDRVVNFKQGSESWNNVRIEVSWRDAMNKEMKGTKAFPLPLESAWKESTHEFPIPDGAAMVQFRIGFWGSMGTADIDDLRVTGE